MPARAAASPGRSESSGLRDAPGHGGGSDLTSEAPLRRDAAENRERLISAATEVFNDEGIDAGVERIAQRAGVGVGTLYRRFGTKEALIECLVLKMLDTLTRAAIEATTQPGGGGLERFLRTAADEFSEHRGYLRRIWDRSAEHHEAVDALRRHVDRLTDDARAAGAIRPSVRRADITTIMWALQGIVDNAQRTDADPRAACHRMLDLSFRGLA
jgi:AcrR family transcriptional regulator